jgi:hypothetical protein
MEQEVVSASYFKSLSMNVPEIKDIYINKRIVNFQTCCEQKLSH